MVQINPIRWNHGIIVESLGLLARVLGLPVRDCAGRSNNRCLKWPKLIAIGVTAKTFLERLYLVPGLGPFWPRVNCPCAPTSPLLTRQLFLDFRAISPPELSLIFLVSTICQVIWPSPGTLLWPTWKREQTFITVPVRKCCSMCAGILWTILLLRTIRMRSWCSRRVSGLTALQTNKQPKWVLAALKCQGVRLMLQAN